MFSTLGRTTARAATKAMARAPSAAAAPAAASVACLNMVTGMAAPAISAAPKAAYHTTAPTLDGSGRLFGAAPIEDAEAISHIGFAFMGSKVLFAALELEVFTTLSPEHGGAPADGMTLEAMAAATSVDERSLTTLTTALLSMGLLAKDATSLKFTNVPAAEAYLVRGAKYDFGDYLRLQIDKQMYPFMDHFADALKGKRENQKFETYSEWFSDEKEARLYTESQHSGSVGPARSLARAIPETLEATNKLLDLGGGSGGFSMTLAQKFPNLNATVLDFPNVCKVGEEFAAVSEPFVGDRVKFLGGNALETEYPKDQDMVLMSYISGSISGDDVKKMYKGAFEALRPGGTVVVHDFMVEDTRDGPPLAALWACQHLVFTPGAVSLTPGYVSEELAAAGFESCETATMIPGLTMGVFGKKPL